MIILAVLAPIISYFLGSISFAVIFTKCFSGTDVRSHGSGNAGTTNVLRVSGLKAGILTFICDAAKGAASCLIGMFLFGLAFGKDQTELCRLGSYVCGLACMIGHAYPLFFNFAGGKCAATGMGVFTVCCPLSFCFGMACYAVSMLITRIVSLSTLIAATVAVVVSCVVNGIIGGIDVPIIVLSILFGVIVFSRHKANIIRLKNGEEKPLSIKRNT